MKLVELICSCAIICSFFPYISGAIVPAIKVHSRTVRIQYEVRRDKFLYKGFVNLCKTTGESEWLSESSRWKEICSSMWDFDDFKICKEGRLYKETWKCGEKNMEALFYKSQEML